MSTGDALKRVLVGTPFRSDRLGETLLPKRLALPVFASDALSSVAYAPNEILLTLAVAGVGAYAFSWPIGLAVAVVMLVVVASYRQNVHAYPSGGGDYEVATENLGPRAGLTVASALLVDYVLTVAVSISSATAYAAGLVPALRGHEVPLAVGAIVLLMALNLRGMRESGTLFAIPTYVFIVAVLAMVAWGGTQALLGDLAPAESARFTTAVQPGYEEGLTTLAGAFLLLRAFSSGCAALTGVEAISNGVPAFRTPRSRNAATTLALLGALAVTMILAILALAGRTGVVYVDERDPAAELRLDGVTGVAAGDGTVAFPDGTVYHQAPVLSQLAHAVFGDGSLLSGLVVVSTGLILVLAANTAFNGFPVLGSILARDGFLPRQLRNRGDRLAFSNGILMLSGAAIALVVVFDAEVTRLIQLYIVGVFVSFTLSQLGMVRHWTRTLRRTADDGSRGRQRRARAIAVLGCTITGSVLVVVVVTKFALGAWLAILAMAVLFALMSGVRRHYRHVAEELEVTPERLEDSRALPTRVHAVVLVSNARLPTMRAVAYARATRPSTLEAVTVDVEASATEELRRRWAELAVPVPLTVLESPYREISRAVVRHVRERRRARPQDLVVVYVPEYVVGHWWEQVLHNQSALRVKTALHFTPGVVVASVPWQLRSSAHAGVPRLHHEDEAG